jgi:hypothetical protein
MAAIPTNQARPLFTKALADAYKEQPKPTGFLKSFFPAKESGSRYISIEVERGLEKIAADVARGTEGNRNIFGKTTERIYDSLLYDEFFDLTQLDLYDRLFASTSIDESAFADLLMGATEKLMVCRNKIERSYEKQCADVLETGIIAFASGDTIDFKRKSASLVSKTATPWNNDTYNPIDHLAEAGTFLRTKGKMQGGRLNAVMGNSALAAFLKNAKVTGRADIRNFSLDAINAPQRNAMGGVLHGIVSAGAWEVLIWSYPEYYDTKTTSNNPYVNEKKVIVLPDNPRFILQHTAVPQLPSANGGMIDRSAYVVYENVDQKHTAHEFGVKSAGVAIPVAVDQIYTMQVLS